MMKKLLHLSSVVPFLACALLANAQTPLGISKIPATPATGQRIVEVAAKSPYRKKQEPAVEVFDRQRTLDERQRLSLDGQSGSRTYGSQTTSATQTLLPANAPLPSSPQTTVLPANAPQLCCDAAERIPARHWRRLSVQEQCDAARDMFPHQAYQAPYGGAYYFRPYVAEQIGRQADLIGNWGGDRTNPYDNRFLQAIYAQPHE